MVVPEEEIVKQLLVLVTCSLLAVACTKTETANSSSGTATTTTASATDAPVAVSTAADASGVVDIRVGAEFSPSTIAVKAGQPVTLRFHRGEEASCADEVVFASLNQRHKITKGQVTEVKITPEKPGDIAFVCGMNMMKGKIVAQ